MSSASKTATAVSRKERAVSFLRLAAEGQAREAFRRYVGKSFRHHNPYFPSDGEGLMRGMEANAAENPQKALEIQRSIEEGDLVAVHSRVRMKPGDLGLALVHIFRFENDRIVELWDLGQPVPAESPNENGMF